ncbi:hypothetical protein B0O99DRAFT_144859 [Bisporella sp. PMI_857]|nr:hypothetical protein B0O99DRAFT_144859 [Bisporella sp. PMI_857]
MGQGSGSGSEHGFGCWVSEGGASRTWRIRRCFVHYITRPLQKALNTPPANTLSRVSKVQLIISYYSMFDDYFEWPMTSTVVKRRKGVSFSLSIYDRCVDDDGDCLFSRVASKAYIIAVYMIVIMQVLATVQSLCIPVVIQGQKQERPVSHSCRGRN